MSQVTYFDDFVRGVKVAMPEMCGAGDRPRKVWDIVRRNDEAVDLMARHMEAILSLSARRANRKAA